MTDILQVQREVHICRFCGARLRLVGWGASSGQTQATSCTASSLRNTTPAKFYRWWCDTCRVVLRVPMK